MTGGDVSSAGNPAIEFVRILLERRKAALYEDIQNYPTPIAACDLHLGFLMEQRDAVMRQIEALDAIAVGLRSGHQDRAVSELIDSLTWVDERVRGDLLAGRIPAVPSTPA